MARQKRLRVLLVGYLPPPIGGVRVLFRQLAEDLKKEEAAEIVVINLTGQRRHFLFKALGLWAAACKILYHIGRVDVLTFHPTNRTLAVLGPFVYLAAKIFRRPLIMRKFAGNYHEVYQRYPGILRWLLRKTIFKADICLFETFFLRDFFSRICRRAEYYPNNRPLPVDSGEVDNRPKKARRFVFISHMKRAKGVLDLFEASDHLAADIQVHLYGPLDFDISPEETAQLNRRHRAQYRGQVPPEAIAALLSRYDAVVLPSLRKSEGYPGIILEAYAFGLPVIATRCGAIPEIVNEDSGLLIEAGNQRQLIEAIAGLHADEELFRRLRKGAARQSARFDSRKWSQVFLDYCIELREGGKSRR